jgi:hypothetical protein
MPSIIGLHAVLKVVAPSWTCCGPALLRLSVAVPVEVVTALLTARSTATATATATATKADSAVEISKSLFVN